MTTIKIEKTIELFDKLQLDKYSRYHSWHHCYTAFSELNKTGNEDLLALNLGFYLASWGMYRGSSGLLQKDYKVHVGAIEIVKDFKGLRCDESSEIGENDKDQIMNLIKELKRFYSKKDFEYEIYKKDKSGGYKLETDTISATDTLISKIILGSLGCLPAFDRYFLEGVNQGDFKITTLEKSLPKLLELFRSNSVELDIIQRHILKQGLHYNRMKILDLHFWYEGFEKELKI